MEMAIFSEELRMCLDASGLSDFPEVCNYWYQRVIKAHNDSVERQIATEQAESERLLKSINGAAGIIAGMCGECPVSRYEWLPSDSKCEGGCTSDTEQCWVEYLMGMRWDGKLWREIGVDAR